MIGSINHFAQKSNNQYKNIIGIGIMNPDTVGSGTFSWVWRYLFRIRIQKFFLKKLIYKQNYRKYSGMFL